MEFAHLQDLSTSRVLVQVSMSDQAQNKDLAQAYVAFIHHLQARSHLHTHQTGRVVHTDIQRLNSVHDPLKRRGGRRARSHVSVLQPGRTIGGTEGIVPPRSFSLQRVAT